MSFLKVPVWFHWAMPTYFSNLFLRDIKKYVKICKYPILKSFFSRSLLCLPLKTIICKINILLKIVSMIEFLLRTQSNLTLCKVWQQMRWGAWALTWRSFASCWLALSGFSDESCSIQFLPILVESTVDLFRNK